MEVIIKKSGKVTRKLEVEVSTITATDICFLTINVLGDSGPHDVRVALTETEIDAIVAKRAEALAARS